MTLSKALRAASNGSPLDTAPQRMGQNEHRADLRMPGSTNPDLALRCNAAPEGDFIRRFEKRNRRMKVVFAIVTYGGIGLFFYTLLRGFFA
mgnify:CR=1 FL=1|tara:strand:- start:73 stop:345 length:273 start_codon:yes stop_codon:yes gene_type:complete